MHSRIYTNKQIRVRNLDWKKSHWVKKPAIIIKLYDKSNLIGNCYIQENWIYNLVINPKYRNKGFGAKLLNLAEKEVRKKYKTIHLTPQDNEPLLREFYSKQGYIGRSDKDPYYEEEDKYWWEMWKNLI